MNKLRNLFSKKNSKKHFNDQEVKELYVFSTIKPVTDCQFKSKLRPISALSIESNELSYSSYENDVMTLFKVNIMS